MENLINIYSYIGLATVIAVALGTYSYNKMFKNPTYLDEINLEK